eukprot:2100707-Pyramimonas_sp.AAC.1
MPCEQGCNAWSPAAHKRGAPTSLLLTDIELGLHVGDVLLLVHIDALRASLADLPTRHSLRDANDSLDHPDVAPDRGEGGDGGMRGLAE